MSHFFKPEKKNVISLPSSRYYYIRISRSYHEFPLPLYMKCIHPPQVPSVGDKIVKALSSNDV